MKAKIKITKFYILYFFQPFLPKPLDGLLSFASCYAKLNECISTMKSSKYKFRFRALSSYLYAWRVVVENEN